MITVCVFLNNNDSGSRKSVPTVCTHAIKIAKAGKNTRKRLCINDEIYHCPKILIAFFSKRVKCILKLLSWLAVVLVKIIKVAQSRYAYGKT